MSKSDFNLADALQSLHENDWLHPADSSVSDVKTFENLTTGTKYVNRNYWIAQFSHLLMGQYGLSAAAVARILNISSRSVISRSVERYPEVDFKNIFQVQAELLAQKM